MTPLSSDPHCSPLLSLPPRPVLPSALLLWPLQYSLASILIINFSQSPWFKTFNFRVPHWLSWLNIQLLILAQVATPGLWDLVLSWALRHWWWSLLESPSLSKKEKKNRAGIPNNPFSLRGKIWYSNIRACYFKAGSQTAEVLVSLTKLEGGKCRAFSSSTGEAGPLNSSDSGQNSAFGCPENNLLISMHMNVNASLTLHFSELANNSSLPLRRHQSYREPLFQAWHSPDQQSNCPRGSQNDPP